MSSSIFGPSGFDNRRTKSTLLATMSAKGGGRQEARQEANLSASASRCRCAVVPAVVRATPMGSLEREAESAHGQRRVRLQ
jgi:hypothetical protein